MKQLYSKKIASVFGGLLLSAGASLSYGQCSGDSVHVTVDVHTDNWGEEVFWDLTPTGNGCGNGALFTFGNTDELDCNGEGNAVSTGDYGYASNSVITEDLGCLAVGDCFDINYVDDYGDGGAVFYVKYNGVEDTIVGEGVLSGGVYTFCADWPHQFDAKLIGKTYEYTRIPLSQAAVQALNTTCKIVSFGADTITYVSVGLDVKKNGVSVHSEIIAVSNMPSGDTASVTFANYMPTSVGVYTFSYVVNIIETDEVPLNNQFEYTVDVNDSVFSRDNDANVYPNGIFFSSELGSMFELSSPSYITSASVILDFLGMIGSNLNKEFTLSVYDTDANGLPNNLLVSGTAITTVDSALYTVNFNPTALVPGNYFVAVSSNQFVDWYGVGFSENVYTPGATVERDVVMGSPWQTMDSIFASFQSTFQYTPMIRANLNDLETVSELKQSDLHVYPNPAKDKLTVTGAKAESGIEVYNNLGQVVFSGKTTSVFTTVDLSEYKAGVYHIRVSNESETGHAVFVKE